MIGGRIAGKKVNRLTQLKQLPSYGDVVRIKVAPGIKFYAVLNPKDIKYLLVDGAEHFHKGPGIKRSAGKSLGNSLLLSEDEFHRRQRKLAQPAFHHQRIMGYGVVMSNYTQRLMNGWQPGQTLDIHEEMMKLTMQIIAKTLFDADVTENSNQIGEAITQGIEVANQMIMSPIQFPEWFPLPVIQKQKRVNQILSNTIQGFIQARRKSGEDKGDLLSMLMAAVNEEDGQGMDDQQLECECRTLFIAGHETTANVLTWAFYLLSQHPETVKALQTELRTVLGDRPPEVADLAKLTYTDQVIKESMRLYPPAYVGSRQAKHPVTVGGYPFPAKTVFLFSQYLTHRDPRFFPNPESFQPERWTPEFEKALPKFAYFPFGGGPRICIGNQFALMEARLILASILQRWSLTLSLDQPPVEPEPLITLRAKNGIQMRVDRL
jgi:cytochrome P450